jgi:hypothetical protein
MALDDPAAVLDTVGGKAAALACRGRSGFPVPPGFPVTTGAYLHFVERTGLHESSDGGHVPRGSIRPGSASAPQVLARAS